MKPWKSAVTVGLVSSLLSFAPAAWAYPQPTGEMAEVLEALLELSPKPIEDLSAVEARQQPSVFDAVKLVLEKKDKVAAPLAVSVTKRKILLADGATVPITIYRPNRAGPFPVTVYFHGGGWVLGTPEAYDASARILANGARTLVVSVDYRRGPEHRFPAAHNDAYSAYLWALQNAKSIGGDPNRVAVAGESAGGNLALGVSLLAKKHRVKMPVLQLVAYPIAGSNFSTPSYRENAEAKPLNRAMMVWFFQNYMRREKDKKSPLIDVVNADLRGLPPTTLITAEIDPLRSEGILLGERLKRAGVPVMARDYKGVTHEFFGMGSVLKEAELAEDFAVTQLRAAFR